MAAPMATTHPHPPSGGVGEGLVMEVGGMVCVFWLRADQQLITAALVYWSGLIQTIDKFSKQYINTVMQSWSRITETIKVKQLPSINRVFQICIV